MVEKSFAERLWEGIDAAVSPYDVPEELVENLKTDLKDAFDVKGKARPGYEPGAVARISINLVDTFTNPLKTIKKTFNAFRGELDRPPVPLAWTDAEDTVWQRVFTTAGVDLRGMPIVSRSLQDAILRWNAGARKRGVRLIREEKGIRESPGLTLMMAQRLNYYYASLPGAPAPIVGGVMLPQITAQAQEYESYVAGRLAVGDWAAATELQVGKQPRHPVTGAQIPSWEDISEPYRDELRKEFERISRLGSKANASAAANALANSDEAKFWRYWQNRNLYFKTLNFLNTWRKDGFWGMVREYGWETLTKYAFKEKTWRYWLYPPNVINKGLGWAAKRVRLTAALTRLTDWRQRLKNFWGRTVKRPLRKALDWIREKVIRKAVRWLITKLGLKVVLAKIGALIGGAIGTAAPGIGNAIGAVLGAVASFIGGIIADYAWKYVLKGALYIFCAAFGCLALAASGGVLFVVLVLGSVFAPGAGGPGAGPPPLPPVYRVTVKKESCLKRIIAGVETWDCQTRSKINNDTGVREIKWQITIENKSDQTAQVVISDTECEETWRYTSDGEGFLNPGDKRIPNCIKNYDTNDLALHNSTVYNTVTGTAWVGSESRDLYAVGMLVIGAPPDAPPCGYPAGTAMSVTSHFMATDVCRRYDRWCGTLPMEGCSVGEVNDVTGIHNGLDLDSNFDGQPLYSTINGTVMHIQSGGGSDWAYITVCNSDWCILYGHTFRSFPVSVGDTVTVGEHIAWLGSTGDVTGPHVHYMVWDRLLPAILTWGNFADCAPNCCVSPLHNPANFLGPCD